MSFLGYTVLFLCWMYCTAERACTEPPPRRVKEVPTEVWDKPPYPHGTQVSYRCRPGYMKLGRIVFECTDGIWKQHFPSAECRNKPCGHPGDMEFGSFELTRGSEFVFGARVEYTCDDGYQMLSQRNYRECQADGWSNDIPHCEVAKCLPVQAPKNGKIIMTGAFELDREYSFGQVVNFECDAKYRLVGLKEIICSSNGKWNSDVPRCEEIACDVPEILHGFVLSPKNSYKEYEQLQFSCDDGYGYGERADTRCTELGWTPTPYCVEIVCTPPRISNGWFSPQKENYVASDTITIRCNPGYRFKTLTAESTSECTKAGWVPDPACIPKPCDYPAIENGRLSDAWESEKDRYFPVRTGQSVDYFCYEGYSTPSRNTWERTYCSETGWFPEPKCLKKCYAGDVENGYFLERLKWFYKEGEKIRYFCNEDYQTERGNGEATCTKNGWSPHLKCIRKKRCQNFIFENGHFLRRKVFRLQESATYECQSGFLTPERQQRGVIQCQQNGWTPPPKCIKSCATPDINILNYHANRTMFLFEDTIEYACLEGYKTTNNMPTGTAKCDITGQWIPMPQCLSIECEMPALPNGVFFPREGKYKNGNTVKFTCKNNYVRVGPASTQCYYFGWFPPPPECKVNARDCGPPPVIANGNVSGGSVERYQHGDRMKYECNIEFKLVGSEEIECVDGEWSSPPSCIEDKMPCGSPSSIPNVVLHQESQTQFSHGDEVILGCKQGFGDSKKKTIKCLNGEWKPLPLCADPSLQCALPRDVDIVRNDRPYRGNKKAAFQEVIDYRCSPSDKKIKRATCVSGSWSPEIECTTENTCPPPPQVPHAQQITVGKNHKNGSKIAISCLEGFQLIGAEEITCIDGKWQSPPYCMERTCLPPQHIECAEVPQLENENLKIEKEGKAIYLPGAKLTYVSRSGYKFNEPPEITCSMGTWTSAPACVELPCGHIPEVANAQIEGRNKATYEPGETIRYQCDAGFLITGPPEIICREGNWTVPPVCEDVSCGAAPELPNAHITSTQQDRYLPGDRVQYECERNFQMKDQNYVTCTNGKWSEPPVCRDVTCGPPPEIAGGKVQGVKKSRYLPGERAQYQCWPGFEMTGPQSVACQNGTWTALPKCKGKGGKCGPPPVIENGDLLSFPAQEYPQGKMLEYKCPSLYILEGSPYIRCLDGQWTSPPVCLVACTAAEEDMHSNNIELKWVNRNKLYSTSGDFIEFRCKEGYRVDPASPPFRAQCVEGTIEYPRCNPGRNCTVNEADMENHNIRLQQSSPSTYSSGEYILFECSAFIRRLFSAKDLRVQCLDGVIKYPYC